MNLWGKTVIIPKINHFIAVKGLFDRGTVPTEMETGRIDLVKVPMQVVNAQIDPGKDPTEAERGRIDQGMTRIGVGKGRIV